MADEARDALLDLLVRWENAQAQDHTVALEDLCRDCPAQADALQREADKLRQMAWLNEPVVDALSTTAGRAHRASPDVALPRVLADRYRLDAWVGEGGFGIVYQGFDTWLERPVAVKVPRVDRTVSGAEVDLCRLEARKVARLRHPHIVSVHDVGRDGGTCFIVSEWIDGESLALRIRRQRPTFNEAARIVSEVADALEEAHRSGFVHRDVKPSNILLDGRDQTYLTDFGIAAVEEELLGADKQPGTPPYMAPEQWDDALGPVDHRADVYAAGVVLYELLTGQRPFEAPSVVELRTKVLHQNPQPVRALEPAVPPALERICVRCLEKDRNARYQRADQLRDDLRKN